MTQHYFDDKYKHPPVDPEPNKPSYTWYAVIATWFGSGKIPVAPGTMGSLATLPFAYLLHTMIGWHALVVAAIVAFTLGWIATRYYLKFNATHTDPKEVVIDEVAGQLLALALVTPTVGGYVMGFVLFRLFDVIKPWPISWFDRHVKGAMGVMLDDILAGIAAMFCPLLLLWLIEDYAAMREFFISLHPMVDAYVPAATY